VSKRNPVVETPVVETAATRSAALVAASLVVRDARAAARKILLSPELLAKIESLYPKGTIVRYVGGRVGERTGALGIVSDYRDGNGLYIEFFTNGIDATGGTYRGSAVPGRVVVVSPAPAPDKPKARRR
jgi:hypothetical protein